MMYWQASELLLAVLMAVGRYVSVYTLVATLAIIGIVNLGCFLVDSTNLLTEMLEE